MVSAIELAKHVIYVANMEKKVITHLQLQKILYYIAGTYAAIYDKPAFFDTIEAWQYGPVIRNVYIKFCPWGSLPLYQGDRVILDYSDDEMEMIDFIIKKKLGIRGSDLVSATHSEAPWKNHEREIMLKPRIEFEELREYFLHSNEVREWRHSKIGTIN